MQRLRSFPIGKSIFASGPSKIPAASFWEAQFLPGWLPIFLGAALGIASAFLIVKGLWTALIPLAIIVPLGILFLTYPFVALMIWMLVFPYIVRIPQVAGRIPYNLLHRAIIPGALVLVILSDWLRIRKREPVRFGRADLVMLLFLGWVIANIVLFSPDTTHSLIRFYDRYIIPFCVYWLIRLIAPTARDLQRFLPIAFITIIAEAVIGMIGIFAPQALPQEWVREGIERGLGSLGNPSVYTSTLIFCALLLLQYAVQGRSRLLRAVCLLTFGLTYLCVFLSFSRGAWLGGSLVLLGLMFVYPKVVVRLLAIGLTVMLVLGTTILAQQIAFAYVRLNTVETVQGRILGGAKSVQMIVNKPFFGWGYDTYDLYDEEFRTRVANLATDQQKTSHNTYLTLMAETGIPALILYVLPILWWLKLSRKVWRRLPQTGFFSWHLLVMLWLLILNFFTVSSFMDMLRFNLFGTTVWWMALGLIANLVYPYIRPGDIGIPRWLHPPKRETS